MAEYEPPTETLPIFDPVVFSTGDEPLTYNIAVKKFLKYPSAQGTENLQAINVNGISTFNAAANFNKPIVMSSATVADREIESSTYTVLNASNTDIGSVSYTSNSILYNSKTASARHVFNNTTSLGVNLEVMSMTADSGIAMTRPLVMTGTTLNRAITSSSYKMVSGANVLSGEIAMSGADQFYYQNTVNGGNHSFLTRTSGGAQATPLKLSATAIDVNTTMNINNGSIPYGVIGTSGPDQIYYQNNINGGNHSFLVRNSGGTIITPLLINSNGLIMNSSGNYIQFPDGTQQTTAATSTPLKTYTEYIPAAFPNLPSKTVTIPAGCYAIDIMAISGGGNAGTNDGSTFNGGSGGGGQVVKSNSKIAVSPGQQIIIYFATSVGGTFIRGENAPYNSVLIRSAGADELATVVSRTIQVNGVLQTFTDVIGVMKNGLDGGNGTSTAHGAGASAGSDLPAFAPVACSWVTYRTTAGKDGNFNTGGRPTGAKWLLQGYGMGGVSTNIAPSTQAGIALVMITYYLS